MKTGDGGRRCAAALTGIVLAAGILAASTMAANALRTSDVYDRSRIIRMLLTEEGVRMSNVAESGRNVDMVLKFAGALASAYIDFEMIPVGEAGTFAAVFESIPPDTAIEKFEYHRKNLTIIGNAGTMEEYGQLLEDLRESDHFESVSGHYYEATDNSIRFEIICAAKVTQVYLDMNP